MDMHSDYSLHYTDLKQKLPGSFMHDGTQPMMIAYQSWPPSSPWPTPAPTPPTPTPAPTPPVPKHEGNCTIEEGVDYHGGDIDRQPCPNVSKCADQCERKKGCNYYTWYINDKEAKGGRCDMKDTYDRKLSSQQNHIGGACTKSQVQAPVSPIAWVPFSSATDTIGISKCGIDDFQLWHTAPVQCDGAYALLGEVGADQAISKWIPVSPKRFVGAMCNTGKLVVTVIGASGEVMSVAFADMKSGKVVVASCTFDSAVVRQAASDGTCV
jgi:hypothetical protein